MDRVELMAGDANKHVYTSQRDDHPQYARTDGTRAFTGNVTVNGTVTATSLTQTVDDASWNAAVLTNGSNFGSPYFGAGYRKVNGRIYLRGCVTGLTVGQNIFTLPSGYRPAATLAPQVNANGQFGVVTVSSAGIVNLNAGPAGTIFVFLDTISFDTL